MTREIFNPTPVALISGIGPYNIGHPYGRTTDLQFVVNLSGVVTVLNEIDFSVFPLESDTTGEVTLTTLAATNYAGGKLYVQRYTQVEQGFSGNTHREKGLEAQLDVIAMGVQDAARSSASNVQVLESSENGNFVVSIDEISNAQSNALLAEQAAIDAEEARDAAAASALLATTDTVKTNVAAQTISGTLTLDAGTSGTALAVANGNVVDVNRVVFNDVSNVVTEGIGFLKSSTAVRGADGTYDPADMDFFRIYGRIPRVNDREILLSRPYYQETAMMSDAQPDTNPDAPNSEGEYPDQVAVWRDILADIPEYHPHVTSVDFAGDAVDRGEISAIEAAENINEAYGPEEFVRDTQGIEIYALLGNHGRSYLAFPDRVVLDPTNPHKQWGNRPFYYVVKGSVVSIYMGDMGNGTAGHIPDYVFDWWHKVCLHFRNKDIRVFTHQLIPDTLAGTFTDHDTNEHLIRDGQRFIDAMTTYPEAIRVTNISVWGVGHKNTHTATQADHQMVAAHDTTFVNVALHIPSALEGAESDLTYVVMCATDGEKDVVFKRWNHKTKAFIAEAEFTIEFKYPLVLKSVPEVDGRYQQTPFDLHDGTQTTHMHVEHIPSGVPTNYKTNPHWLSRGILDDRYGGNMHAGIKVGHAVNLPGGADSDPREFTRGYGFAAAWLAEKTEGSDTDYSADFVAFASGAGQYEDSKIEALRGHSDGSISTPGGIRSHFDSGWISGFEKNSFLDVVHGLGTTDIEIASFRAKTVRDGRIFVGKIAQSDSTGLGLEFLDADTIQLSSANTNVFHRDNTHTGSSAEYFNGIDNTAGGGADERVEFRIHLRKIPS